ncbi:MAG: hypothetical protein OJF49_002481 [Ktedonobacterales bacterium]|nr:MAG: hypothetical protein OJF49_002481 [Ktedonobacterales bacterium]
MRIGLCQTGIRSRPAMLAQFAHCIPRYHLKQLIRELSRCMTLALVAL